MNSTFVCDDSFAQIMVDWEIMMIKAFFVDFYGTLGRCEIFSVNSDLL